MATKTALGPDVVGLELAATQFSYEERDIMLYALGVGAKELDFIFERGLKALPTFAVIPAFPALMGLSAAVEINPVMILHGEQGFRIQKTIPTSGTLTTAGKITGVYDKGKGALVTIETTTKDAGGDVVFTNTSGIFVRGAGGFGGERGPEAGNAAPDRAPDKTVQMPTLDIQAAIYRLSGDRNPLHIDPAFAKMAGFDRPILHGLCTFGHVGRAVLAEYCGNDPARFVSMSVRFSGVVYPGDTIITDMWDEGSGKILVQARTQEGRVAISNALVEVK
ncbi:MAG TPA: MaoC/PaaZ C-terminal domain-containing protein [Dehalococcoidia bacterium]|jgi:acyl dehydratase|nr:MaoC/PaaZ C-terminal domain-containing protein [Dehalococcoidia bacterium]